MLHVYVSVPSVIFLRFSVPWSQNLILYTALFISYFCAYYVTYFLQELMQQYLLQKKRTRHQTCMISNFDCQILTIYKTSEIFQLIVMVKVKSWWLNEKKIVLIPCQIISFFKNTEYDRYIKIFERWSNVPSTGFLICWLSAYIFLDFNECTNYLFEEKNTRCGPIFIIILQTLLGDHSS